VALAPIASVRSIEEFQALGASAAARDAREFDAQIIKKHERNAEWTFRGHSVAAGREVDFIVDSVSGLCEDGVYYPNLRERLICPETQLNNRQRLMAGLILQSRAQSIYFMEQVTPIYAWAKGVFDNVVGSEYMGPDWSGGEIVNGIRHEDIQNLSFDDGSFDLVVSNDVLEHVPWPALALAECRRVLKAGGKLVATIPFYDQARETVARASLIGGEIVHHAEKQFHGNPVSDEGSLVFTDYGWDLLPWARRLGFSDARLDVYHQPSFGHLGPGLLVFVFER
jgi:hypothetical protein